MDGPVTPFYQDAAVTIFNADCREALRELPDGAARTCVTSPPYFGLRDYGHEGQIGLEQTPDAYVAELVDVFRSIRRVLADDGTLWLNLGDTYAQSGGTGVQGITRPRLGRKGVNHLPKPGRLSPPDGLKAKDLIGIPWRVAFALQADGWWLRQDIVWHKPNPMPESVRDRCVKAHEYLFLLSKSERYFFDHRAMLEPAEWPEGPGNRKPYVIPAQREGENSNLGGGLHRIGPRETRTKRSVWSVCTRPYHGAHFATFPPELIQPCILAGSAPGDLVIDPFGGAGTTALVAKEAGRRAVLAELNPDYAKMAADRVGQHVLGFAL